MVVSLSVKPVMLGRAWYQSAKFENGLHRECQKNSLLISACTLNAPNAHCYEAFRASSHIVVVYERLFAFVQLPRVSMLRLGFGNFAYIWCSNMGPQERCICQLRYWIDKIIILTILQLRLAFCRIIYVTITHVASLKDTDNESSGIKFEIWDAGSLPATPFHPSCDSTTFEWLARGKISISFAKCQVTLDLLKKNTLFMKKITIYKTFFL